jgi:hypothetical protein
LIQIGREERLRRIYGNVVVRNREMQQVCRELDFAMHRTADDSELAELDLSRPPDRFQSPYST